MKKPSRYLLVGALLALAARGSAQATVDKKATATPPASVSLGRLWVNVARWKWRASKPGQPLPAFDSTSVENFRKSVKAENPANIYTLYNDVLDELHKQDGYGGVSNQQFVPALESVLRKKAKNPNAPQAAAVTQLLAHLNALSPQPTTTSATPTAGTAASVVPQNQVAPPATPADPQLATTQAALKQAQAENQALRLHRRLLGIVAALLALAAGGLAWRRKAAPVEAAENPPPAPASDPQAPRAGSTAAFNKFKQEADGSHELATLQRRHEKLQQAFDDLQAQNDILHREKQALTKKKKPREVAASVASPAPAAPPPTPVATTAQFAEMPENRYVARLYPDSEAFRPLLVRLPDDPAATEASFEFNPSADQYFFTHNGVDQLLAAFTYAPPNWLSGPQTIRTLTPGRLRRDATGWHVSTPAHIEIC